MTKEIDNLLLLGISEKKLQEMANNSGMSLEELTNMINGLDVEVAPAEKPTFPDIDEIIQKTEAIKERSLESYPNEFISNKMKKYNKKNR